MLDDRPTRKGLLHCSNMCIAISGQKASSTAGRSLRTRLSLMSSKLSHCARLL